MAGLLIDPVGDPTALLPTDGTLDTAKATEPFAISTVPDTLGRENEADETLKQIEANELDNSALVPDGMELFADSFMRAASSGDNAAIQLFKRVERESISPPLDPAFDPEEYITRNRTGIPAHLEKQFRLAGSEFEANLILKDMHSELVDQEILARRGGFSTFVARGLSGIIDLDAPLTLMTGGATKAGIMATRWGRLASGAATGGLTAASLQGVAVQAGTTQDWTSIPAAALGGMAFGTLAGLARSAPEVKANEALGNLQKEFDEFVDEGAPLAQRDFRAETHLHDDVYGSRKAEDETLLDENAPAKEGETREPEAFKVEDLELRPDSVGELEGKATVGARQMNSQGSVNTVTNTRSQDVIRDSTRWAQTTGIPSDYFAKNSRLANQSAAGDVVAKQAMRFHDAIVASPLTTDFDRLMRSGSVVAQRLAYDVFESAAGIVRNNRSAANLKDHYEKRLAGSFLPAYEDAYKINAHSNGLSWYERLTDNQAREAFNRQVAAELNGRAFDAPGTQRSVAPGVKEAADAHDRWSALDIEIGRGRPGEGSIQGYDTLTPYSGYMSQKWVGYKFENLIRNGRTADDITDAIAESYLQMHRGMSPADARVWAAAIVRRARASDRGTDASLLGILQQDGRGFLEDTLRSNGIPAQDVTRLIDRLTGEAALRGQAGHTKGRIDVDMRFTASNGISMMDLFDTDLSKIVARRARGTAGNAALARKGILSRTDRADIKEAILQEQQARGPSQKTGTTPRERVADAIDEDKHLTAQDIDDLFSYFDAGPIAGGISPLWSNMKKITNLALLNQLGLTQMAEFGAQMSSVGVGRWFDHAGPALREAMGNPNSPLVDELRHMSILVPEERLFRDDYNLEMDKMGTAQSELMQRAQNLLDKGSRLQGYTSGFYAVRNFQQRVAVTSAADKIMQNMAGMRGDLTIARAEDIGLDAQTFAAIKRYATNGTVTFNGGSLERLNFDKWAPEDVENFALALNRHVNQVVQKAMAGESNILFHRDGVASLFFHLKSFPMLALEKQAMRNLRIGDGQALASFFAGLGTAAVAYGVRQAISGNSQNLTTEKLARGAIGYSNMTGWLPMWTDPIANVLGMDSLRFNTYAQGIEDNVFSSPAAFTTLNKMLNIPGAALNIATGNLTNNDIRAIQTTPILGNAYGITAILNAMKD